MQLLCTCKQSENEKNTSCNIRLCVSDNGCKQRKRKQHTNLIKKKKKWQREDLVSARKFDISYQINLLLKSYKNSYVTKPNMKNCFNRKLGCISI